MVNRRINQRLATLLHVVNTTLVVGIVWLTFRSSNETTTKLPDLKTETLDAGSIATPNGPLLPNHTFYHPLWQRDLRQPPIPMSPETSPEAMPPPSPELPRLVGTFVDAETAWGHFELRDGRTRLRPPDSEMEGYRVVTIVEGRAKLVLGTSEYWIEVPRPH